MKTSETALVTRSAAFISWTPLSRPSRHGLGYERAVVTQMKAADRATKALSTPLSAEWRPRVVFAREEGGRRSQPHRPPQMRSATKRMHKPTSETAPFRGHRPVHDNPPAAGAVPARHGRDGREPPLVRGGGSGPPLQSNPAQSPLPPVAPSQSRLRAKRRVAYGCRPHIQMQRSGRALCGRRPALNTRDRLRISPKNPRRTVRLRGCLAGPGVTARSWAANAEERDAVLRQGHPHRRLPREGPGPHGHQRGAGDAARPAPTPQRK